MTSHHVTAIGGQAIGFIPYLKGFMYMPSQKTHEIAQSIGETPVTPYFEGSHQRGITYRQLLIAQAIQGSAAQLIADEKWFPTSLDRVVTAAVAIADEVLTAIAHESNQ